MENIQLPCGPSPPPCRLRSAFCVLCCGGRCKQRPRHMRKCTQKISEKTSKIYQKSSENRSKIIKNRGLEGSWEGLGEVLAPFCAPGLPQRRPSDEKFAQPPFVPYFLGSQKSSIFDIFAIFVDLFCGRFSEACFGGLRPPI